jgi:D-alanine-D-alanine ligase
LPGLTPGYSDLCLIATAAGIDYRTLIGEILAGGLKRLREKRRADAARNAEAQAQGKGDRGDARVDDRQLAIPKVGINGGDRPERGERTGGPDRTDRARLDRVGGAGTPVSLPAAGSPGSTNAPLADPLPAQMAPQNPPATNAPPMSAAPALPLE